VTDAAYRRIMSVNVDGVVFGVRALVPLIARRGGGAVVATASLAGIMGFAPDPIYTLTKHAVVG
jgi:NAD(P)-dependent dehydrogenase (short-subunit alcohol dehydrogenase family)